MKVPQCQSLLFPLVRPFVVGQTVMDQLAEITERGYNDCMCRRQRLYPCLTDPTHVRVRALRVRAETERVASSSSSSRSRREGEGHTNLLLLSRYQMDG